MVGPNGINPALRTSLPFPLRQVPRPTRRGGAGTFGLATSIGNSGTIVLSGVPQ